MDVYKCGYKYCKNGGKVKKEDSILIGTKHYCKECLKEKDGKEQIRRRYFQEIDNHANMTQLNMVIKRLINDDENEVEFILYMLDYVKANKIKINNPFGLTWTIKDDKLIRRYKKEVLTRKANEIRMNIDMTNNEDINDSNFQYNPSQPKWMKEI